MARKYIDANILFKNITDHHYLIVSYSNSIDYGMFTTGIKQAIDEIPAADVQEVVRCKDCKFNGYCSVQDYVMFKDDNYCSRGIRTDGEENENV